MKPFAYFLSENEVKPITPDINEAKSLIDDANNRFNYFQGMILSDVNSKYIIENLYESIRELLDAILLINGFRSYSHQAPIVYVRDKKIVSDKDAAILDELRVLRNKLKYSGKTIDLDTAKNNKVESIELYEKINRYINKEYRTKLSDI